MKGPPRIVISLRVEGSVREARTRDTAIIYPLR